MRFLFLELSIQNALLLFSLKAFGRKSGLVQHSKTHKERNKVVCLILSTQYNTTDDTHFTLK